MAFGDARGWLRGPYQHLSLNTPCTVLFGLDTWRVRHNMRRISEHALLIAVAMSGASGGWIVMQVFRHKTRIPGFIWAVVCGIAREATLCVGVVVCGR
jgi:uncharacterized membrane protein YsdA (DUF1294 family)